MGEDFYSCNDCGKATSDYRGSSCRSCEESFCDNCVNDEDHCKECQKVIDNLGSDVDSDIGSYDPKFEAKRLELEKEREVRQEKRNIERLKELAKKHKMRLKESFIKELLEDMEWKYGNF